MEAQQARQHNPQALQQPATHQPHLPQAPAQQPPMQPPMQQSPGFFDRARDLLRGRSSQDRGRDQVVRALAWPTALVASVSLLALEGQNAVAEPPGFFNPETVSSPEPLHLQLGLEEEIAPMSDPSPTNESESQSEDLRSDGPVQEELPLAPLVVPLHQGQPFVRVTNVTIHQTMMVGMDDPAASHPATNLLVKLWLLALTFGSVALALAHLHQRRLLPQSKDMQQPSAGGQDRPANDESVAVVEEDKGQESEPQSEPEHSEQSAPSASSLAEQESPSAVPSSFTHTLSVATRQGHVRSENQDAVWGHQFAPDCSALIVCDGAGGVAGGREASQQAVRVMAAHLAHRFNTEGRFGLEDLTRAITLARDTNRDSDLSGITTALLAILQGDELIYATLGDGALSVLWPDGMVTHLQALHHTAGQPDNIINAFIGHDCQVPPRLGWQKLEPGCVTMLMSDGASDIFPFEDYGLNRDAHLNALQQFGASYADKFLVQLEDACDEQGAYLHSDNLSLGLIALGTEREGEEVSHG